MPTYRQYHEWRAQGRCPVCGRERDQPPYVQCSRCYTPKPKSPTRPGLTGLSPREYSQAYNWHVRQRDEPALAIGCCGQSHAVTQVPFRTPCCGRVFGSLATEEHLHEL